MCLINSEGGGVGGRTRVAVGVRVGVKVGVEEGVGDGVTVAEGLGVLEGVAVGGKRESVEVEAGGGAVAVGVGCKARGTQAAVRLRSASFRKARREVQLMTGSHLRLLGQLRRHGILFGMFHNVIGNGSFLLGPAQAG